MAIQTNNNLNDDHLPIVIDVDLAYTKDRDTIIRRFATDEDEQDGGEGGEDGGSGRLEPTGRKRGGLLVNETITMENARRLQEQQGHRRFARVIGSDRTPATHESPQEGAEKAESPLAHPYLDSQRFDGIDPNLNPEPAIGSQARTEYDNARREQQLQKQARLGNAPSRRFNPTPGY